MFDMLMDAVYVSMMKLGYKDVDIAVGETGWSSAGETFEQPRCSVENAAAYNGGLVKKIDAGRGTPLMPRKKFDVYIFGLFNENQKSGPLSERNFGLFRPDFTQVYEAGVLRADASVPVKVIISARVFFLKKSYFFFKNIIKLDLDYESMTELQ